MVSTDTDRGDQPALVLCGTIDGTDLHHFADALEDLQYPGGSTVVIDLTGVTSWSMLAQAMILSTARIVSRHGSELVLYGPSISLRHQSKRMDVFGRVTTRARPVERRRATLGRTLAAVAILVIEDGRLLLLRRHDDETLNLPGGMVRPNEDPRTALARHVDRQLGIALDWPTIRESMTVRSVVADEPRRRLHEICFHSRFVGLPTAGGEVCELVWVDSWSLGAFAPAALEVRAILKRGGYIE